jgi:hypothetical protein
LKNHVFPMAPGLLGRMQRSFAMVSLPVIRGFGFSLVCFVSLASPAFAGMGGPMPAGLIPGSPADASRLLALATAGQPKPAAAITPTLPPTQAANAPASCATSSANPQSAVPTSIAGMRFMPLHHDQVARSFPVPPRRETVATAEAVRVAVAASANQSDLAQTILQTAAAPSARAQAEEELGQLKTSDGAPLTNPNAANPSILANQAVMREMQRYRTTHGLY